MLYEIVFNCKPNLGNEKKFVETSYENDKAVENEIIVEQVVQPVVEQVVEPIVEQVVEPVEPATKSRKLVSLNLEKAAKKIEEKHNKKRNKRTLEFDVGDKVSVLIPRIDRGGSDLPRLPGFISRKSGEFYAIVTELGILNDCLRVGDLEMYHGPLYFDYKSIKSRLPLRKAAMLVTSVQRI
ncbi:hypothetical protein BpHYR1_024772 [Brachionus plicatilis]|uniref:Uncharacterized protein n=1 Tax=Brachionus plicatilis TaxID=10195 RepID=A0A3M7S9H5_BRAPC|nr:hypothetical protein BpHYR1_024772 [Brachionus plicatilis]